MKQAWLLTVMIALALGAGCKDDAGQGTAQAAQPKKEAAPPEPQTAAPGAIPKEVAPPTEAELAAYTADLKGGGDVLATLTTRLGTIHCKLLPKEAPLTVANFVGLGRGLKPFRDPATGQAVTRPFYDGLKFHRVIEGFMIQGGDPKGNGSGGPGYKFKNESAPGLTFDVPGVLAMANAGPNTNGSQFFITVGQRHQLDGGYTIFGKCKDVDRKSVV